ncbi:MAG: hypothetical protein HQL97_17210 [Magnetococcales bacterium]|nr:hypothetical protein [Magnetococcales bacterium]
MIHEKYGALLGDFYFSAGTNMGKPIWFIRMAGGSEIESNDSLQGLLGELEKWIKAHPGGVK